MLKAAATVTDLRRLARDLSKDPIQTVVTHLTHEPPLVNLICRRRRVNLTIDQVKRLHAMGQLPDRVVMFLMHEGVL